MTESKSKTLYSPLQAGTGAFLGGPLAGTQMLWSNFIALGKDREAKWTLWIGIAVTIATLALAFALPSKALPTPLIPLLVALATRFIGEKYQLKKEAIAASPEYVFQANWKVVVNGLLALAVTLLFAFIMVFTLSALGIVVLPE